MIVWYLVLSLSTGAIAIPQTNHDQCVINRGLENQRGVYHAYCVPGGTSAPVINGSVAPDDDD